jgi:hypothetical protein
MNNLSLDLAIDIITLVTTTFLLLRFGRISMMHPAPTYILFHLFECTQRLVQLALGAPPSMMFARQPLTDSEITKAVYLFDLVLIVVTVAWLLVAYLDYRAHGPLPKPANAPSPNIVPKYFLYVSAVMIPLGAIGLVQSLIRSHGFASGEVRYTSDMREHYSWDTSYAAVMIQSWIGIAFIPLIYLYGLRRKLMIPFGIAGLLILLSATSRFRITLPLIFVCFVYLSRRGMRWPPPILALGLILGALVFLPAKSIGQAIISGEYSDPGSAFSAGLTNWTAAASSSDYEDTQFLDITAAYIALIDRYVDHGENYFLGGTIEDAFWNFIPRPLWPEKPLAGLWIYLISTPTRNMFQFGATASLVGTSYADFGIYGVIAVPFIFAYIMGMTYFRAFRQNYYSVARFTYLIYACTLLQVYRDGIGSFFVFNYINFWPLMLIVVMHRVFRIRKNLQLNPVMRSGEYSLSIDRLFRKLSWKNGPI